MGKYILKRLLWMIPVVVGVAILIFTILYFVPGDPARIMLGSSATEDEVNVLRHTMGLDRPYIYRLGKFLVDTFLRIDLGSSYMTKLPVAETILDRVPNTLKLSSIGILLSVIVGVPLGVNAAVNRNTVAGDRGPMFIAMVGVSMPSFWLALLLVVLFAVKLKWLPAMGVGSFKHWILPAVSGSFGGIAAQARQSRSAMLEVIRSDYITTARAKGLSERVVIYKHALPNALIPVITGIGHALGNMLGGSLIIETIFGIPGMGMYMISGVNNRDYPVVQGCVIVLAVIFSIVMLLTDIAYSFVDPTIKAQYAKGKGR